jgi:hypothetical protein
MTEKTSESSKDLFVEELRNSYQKGWEVKATLETKANNIITISGTVATLLFGFGSLFLESLNPDYQLLSVFIGLLMIGIIASVIAIICGGLSFRIRTYDVPVGPDYFSGKPEKIDEFKKATSDTFNNTMISAYLKCMNQNNDENERKVKYISPAQWLFFISMIVVPILLGVVLHAVYSNAVVLPSLLSP